VRHGHREPCVPGAVRLEEREHPRLTCDTMEAVREPTADGRRVAAEAAQLAAEVTSQAHDVLRGLFQSKEHAFEAHFAAIHEAVQARQRGEPAARTWSLAGDLLHIAIATEWPRVFEPKQCDAVLERCDSVREAAPLTARPLRSRLDATVLGTLSGVEPQSACRERRRLTERRVWRAQRTVRISGPCGRRSVPGGCRHAPHVSRSPREGGRRSTAS
jgi:hypothetical protein